MFIKFRFKINRLLLGIILLSSLASCNSKSDSSIKEDQFTSMFPDIKLGEHLRLVPVSNGPIPRETNRDTIDILIINISDQQIILPPSLPNQNFIYDETKDKWIPIPESLISDGTIITLYSKTDLEKEQFSDWGEPVSPDLSGYKKPIVVRILILGEIAEDEEATGQKVGSYIDITFKP